jgi:hypothetical protein
MSFDRMQCAGRYDAHPHVRSMANEGQEWASFAMCRRFFRASERCDVGDVICTDFGENHRSSFTGIAQPDPSKMNALAREPDEHKVARLTNNKILYVFAVTFFCTMRLYFETGSIRYRIHITPSRRALFPSLRPSRRSRRCCAAHSRAGFFSGEFSSPGSRPPPRAALFAPPPGHTPRRADRARVASRGHGPPRPTARRRRAPRAPGSRPPRSAPDAVGSRPSGVGRAPVVDSRSRAVAPSPHPPADPSTPHTRARRYPQVGSPAGP